MKTEFCPELQLEWIIEKVSFESLSCIKIILYEIISSEKPSIIGRHISDINSYPEMVEIKNKTKFTFHNNLYFNIRDDSAPGYSEEDNGEGKTFQRLLKSELISLHEDRATGSNLIHYRLICLNEIIDIISSEAPEIIK